MASRKTPQPAAKRSQAKAERHVAFLRAINVGSHIVKMAELRRLFEELRFGNVETVINSGNVIFDCATADRQKLERKIEAHLQKNLGYAVATFLRTTAELEAISRARPFPAARYGAGSTLYIGFLGSAPGAEYCERIATLSTPMDDLCVVGREVHWLCQKNMGESRINYAVLEKALSTQATFRNVNTVNRLVAKLTGAQRA